MTARYGPRAPTVLNNHRARLFLSGIAEPVHARARQRPGRRRGGPARLDSPATAGAAGRSTTTSTQRRPAAPARGAATAAPGRPVCSSTGRCRRSACALVPWWDDPELAAGPAAGTRVAVARGRGRGPTDTLRCGARAVRSRLRGGPAGPATPSCASGPRSDHDPTGILGARPHADCLEVLRSRAASVDATHIDPDRPARGPRPPARQSARDRRDGPGHRRHRPFLFRDPPEHTPDAGSRLQGVHPADGRRTAAADRDDGGRAGRRGAAPGARSTPVARLRLPAARSGSSARCSGSRPRTGTVLGAGRPSWPAVSTPTFLQPEGRDWRSGSTRWSPSPTTSSRCSRSAGATRATICSASWPLAEEAGDALTEGQMLSTAILLLVAGHETTVNLISGGLLALRPAARPAGPVARDPPLGPRGGRRALAVRLTGADRPAGS